MKFKRVQFKFPQLTDRVFTGSLLAIIVSLFVLSGALVRFDYFYYDLGRYLGFRPAPPDVVIVAVDEESLSSLGGWPWSRSLHAGLIDQLRLAQARVIGLDIIFSDPEQNNSVADELLAHAIKRAGNVVMPFMRKVPALGSSIKQSFPLPSLAVESAVLGSVYEPHDADGVVRSIYLWEGSSVDARNANGLPHFSQTVLQVANLLPANIRALSPAIYMPQSTASEQGGFVAGHIEGIHQRKIQFSGLPNHFQRISYIKVLSGDFPVSFFKDKIVLVGVTEPGLADAVATPGSAKSQPMPRVELHANAIVSMQNNRMIVDAPPWLTSLVCILFALLPLIWLPKLSPTKSLLAISCYFFGVLLLMVSFPHLVSVWVPPSSALLAIVLIYPIWSYRRLKSIQASLDVELQNLRNELAVLGMEPDDIFNHSDGDPLQSRILKVQLTTKHLRELHRSRSDTLAFISHDIRAPLGAAMMLLDQFGENKHSERMRRMLGRAYNMAESFLQASRAEMANVNKFHELDMVSIVQQAVDDIYEVLLSKQLKLIAMLPEDSVWVRGDFGLLLRAVSNILINAVTYSPQGAAIKVELVNDNQRLTLEITDQGPGIAPTKIPKLFKRFSRLDAEHQSRKGSGLGLYFVDVTIKKHHGSMEVISQLGKGTAFIISLPLERRKKYLPVENDRRTNSTRSFSDTM